MTKSGIRTGLAALLVALVVGAAPLEALAFSKAGTGLEQNSSSPDTIDLTSPVTVANGGTGQTTQQAALDALVGYVTKGSILVGDGSDNVEVTVGTNGMFLKADSTDAQGVAWSKVDVSDTAQITGEIADANVADTITASNYLPLSGGTMTGSLVTDNLGIEFADSDTNPTCSAGEYKIYADLSETTLKKCVNGTTSDLDTTGGASTTIDGKVTIASSVEFSMGASATYYLAPGGRLCATEDECRVPFETGTFDELTCLTTAAQTANNVTVTLCEGACTGALTCDGASLDIPATTHQSATATGSKSVATGDCIYLEVTTGAGEAMASSFLNCSLTVTGPAE